MQHTAVVQLLLLQILKCVLLFHDLDIYKCEMNHNSRQSWQTRLQRLQIFNSEDVEKHYLEKKQQPSFTAWSRFIDEQKIPQRGWA